MVAVKSVLRSATLPAAASCSVCKVCQLATIVASCSSVAPAMPAIAFTLSSEPSAKEAIISLRPSMSALRSVKVCKLAL